MIKFKLLRFISRHIHSAYINELCFYYTHKGHPEWIDQSILAKPKLTKKGAKIPKKYIKQVESEVL